jgi:hypothetical protein
MNINVSLPTDLARWIRAEAIKQHRSFSGQVAFFCAQGMLDPNKGEHTDEAETETEVAHDDE